MLHRKPYIENHLQSAQKMLSARIELLTTNGVSTEQIKKDNQIRHFKALARKAKKELAVVSAIEALTAENSEARLRKEAAAKFEELQNRSKKRDKNTPPAKKRKKIRIESDENA